MIGVAHLALLPALLQIPEALPPAPPAYRLGIAGARSLVEDDASRFRVVDLNYSLSDSFGTFHSFLGRVRLGRSGYVSVRAEGEDRRVAFDGARVSLEMGAAEGSWRFGGAYRGARFEASTSAEDHRREAGGGATIESALTVHFGDRFEAGFDGSIETRDPKRPPEERRTRFWRATALFQKGPDLEGSLSYSSARIRATGGVLFTREELRAAAEGLLGPAAWTSSLALVNTHGRFRRRDLIGRAQTEVPVASRLSVTGITMVRHEPVAGIREHESRIGATLFARRVRIARTSASARRALDLARALRRAGYAARARVLEDAGYRDLRERAALAGLSDEASGARGVHESEIDDRRAPLFGLFAARGERAVTGTRNESYGLIWGLPWPLRAARKADEAAAPFLVGSVEKKREWFGSAFVATSWRASVEAELNRELRLRVAGERSGGSPALLLRNIGSYRTVDFGFVYAYGR